MRLPSPAASALRLPRRTLRAQLAVLYAAVFCTSAAALAAAAVIFKPNFLRQTSCMAAPGTPRHLDPCRQYAAHLSFAGTISHDAKQNLAGVAMIAVLAVLALGIGWLIAGRVLRPLRTITAAARDISAGNLHQRLAVDGPDDEFRQLGETLDGLFGRLEASFQAQRHFVANASHELRTPITAEKTVLQVALADPDSTTAALRSACEKALHWNDQQERLIDGTAHPGQQRARNRTLGTLRPRRHRREGNPGPPPGRRAAGHPHRRGPCRGSGHRGPGPGRKPDGEPGEQRHPAQPGQRPGRDLDGHSRRLRGRNGQQHRATGPARRGRTRLPAISATRYRADPPRQRARAWPRHRPRHRQRPWCSTHSKCPRRGRPRRQGELSVTPARDLTWSTCRQQSGRRPFAWRGEDAIATILTRRGRPPADHQFPSIGGS